MFPVLLLVNRHAIRFAAIRVPTKSSSLVYLRAQCEHIFRWHICLNDVNWRDDVSAAFRQIYNPSVHLATHVVRRTKR